MFRLDYSPGLAEHVSIHDKHVSIHVNISGTVHIFQVACIFKWFACLEILVINQERSSKDLGILSLTPKDIDGTQNCRHPQHLFGFLLSGVVVVPVYANCML